MKKVTKTRASKFPDVPATDVDQHVRKSATVNMRLTPADKAEMERASKSLGLTLTEYLTRCHEAVARHLD